jgi:hemerythrin
VTLLNWSHACTVGVLAMDDQHGILMDTLNELRLALVRGSGHAQVSQVMERLLDYTRMHFASEEQLMERCGFPGLSEHRAAHRDLIKKIHSASYHLQHGEGVRLRPLLNGLRDGYLAHIETLDRQYGPWLNAHGVS